MAKIIYKMWQWIDGFQNRNMWNHILLMIIIYGIGMLMIWRIQWPYGAFVAMAYVLMLGITRLMALEYKMLLSTDEDEMRSEYDFSKGVRGKYIDRLRSK